MTESIDILFRYVLAGKRRLWVVALEVNQKTQRITIRGYRNADWVTYRQYQTHEDKPPYRTIGEIKGLPMPELQTVVIGFRAKIEILR